MDGLSQEKPKSKHTGRTKVAESSVESASNSLQSEYQMSPFQENDEFR